MSSVKRICACAFCIALCCVLPAAFHALMLGGFFSPMHIPVLLCGLICGWPWGALCGAAGPILSCLLTGMPAAAKLIPMAPELCAYGLACGLLMRFIYTGRVYADLYLSLAPAMVLGRIVGGAAKALFYLAGAEPYSIALWVSGYFVESIPGIILHLIAVPALAAALMKTGLVPARRPGAGLRAAGNAL